MRYGVPYKGSKNAVAEWVVDHLPDGERLVDLFAGGCAVTHCAMLRGKYRKYLINDVNDVPKLFCDALGGKTRGRTEWVSREDFHRLKGSDPFVRQVWSFGNDGNSYLYSKELEPYKKAVHMELTAGTMAERYRWHKTAVREALKIIAQRGAKVHEKTMYFQQNTEAYFRCEVLERAENLERAEGDYRAVEIKSGDVVYCDIPYRGTGAEYVDGFDYEAFYEWARGLDVPVVISEYWMPEDRFECIAEKERCGHMCATNNANRKTERLYVPKR